MRKRIYFAFASLTIAFVLCALANLIFGHVSAQRSQSAALHLSAVQGVFAQFCGCARSLPSVCSGRDKFRALEWRDRFHSAGDGLRWFGCNDSQADTSSI